MIRIAIIGVILVVGAVFLLPQTVGLFPDIGTVFDATKSDVRILAENIAGLIEQGLDSSIKAASAQLDAVRDSAGGLV